MADDKMARAEVAEDAGAGAEGEETPPVTTDARAAWAQTDDMCRRAVASWPAGITDVLDGQITAIVRRELRYHILPLLRETCDAVDVLDGEVAERVDEVDGRIESVEQGIAQIAMIFAHGADVQALTDYVRTHYAEDERAAVLAARIETSMRGLATVVLPAGEQPAGAGGEQAGAAEGATVTPIRPGA